VNVRRPKVDRESRTLRITRKGGHQAVVPLTSGTSRAIDLYPGERQRGPMFLGACGGRMDRCTADRMVERPARQAAITKRIYPTVCATRSSPLRSTPGVAPRGAGGGVARRAPHHHVGTIRPPDSVGYEVLLVAATATRSAAGEHHEQHDREDGGNHDESDQPWRTVAGLRCHALFLPIGMNRDS
jgi:hypothetical protein